jgi:hypothetical protein
MQLIRNGIIRTATVLEYCLMDQKLLKFGKVYLGTAKVHKCLKFFLKRNTLHCVLPWFEEMNLGLPGDNSAFKRL